MAHEIHEYDDMFSVIQTPWHGLGKVLKDSPGIDEALEISGLTWNVNSLDIFTEKKEPIKKFKALQREDTKEIFTVVSNRYKVLQNHQAFNVFKPLVENGDISLETAGSLHNGRKVWILGRITSEKEQEVGDGDIVKPYVLLSNSHDGTQAIRIGFTPVRVVCNNTLSMSIKNRDSKLIRVYHKGDVEANLTDLRDMMEFGTASFKARIKDYRLLNTKRINKTDIRKYIRKVFDSDEDIEIRNEKAILLVLNNGKGLGIRNGNEPTLWEIYNAVNEWGLWHKGKNQNRRLTSAWFGNGYTLDNRAFNIALDIAKAA